MDARIDHIVLWVADPLRSVEFYESAVGLPGVRVGEFRDGKAPFPSVRVSDDSIIDLMDQAGAPLVDMLTGADGAAGHPVNHVCLTMSEADFEALRGRLRDHGVDASAVQENSFGARGVAPRAFYFRDPDGNVLEARHYA